MEEGSDAESAGGLICGHEAFDLQSHFLMDLIL
jgi:hypothetical protein